MKRLFLLIFLIGSLSVALNAENNDSTKTKSNAESNASTKVKESAESNASVKAKRAKRAKKQLEEQMKREEKYAKEQTFHQGKNFDLSELEVDPNSLEDIPEIEPDYNFNMDDVYD